MFLNIQYNTSLIICRIFLTVLEVIVFFVNTIITKKLITINFLTIVEVCTYF